MRLITDHNEHRVNNLVTRTDLLPVVKQFTGDSVLCHSRVILRQYSISSSQKPGLVWWLAFRPVPCALRMSVTTRYAFFGI